MINVNKIFMCLSLTTVFFSAQAYASVAQIYNAEDDVKSCNQFYQQKTATAAYCTGTRFVTIMATIQAMRYGTSLALSRGDEDAFHNQTSLVKTALDGYCALQLHQSILKRTQEFDEIVAANGVSVKDDPIGFVDKAWQRYVEEYDQENKDEKTWKGHYAPEFSRRVVNNSPVHILQGPVKAMVESKLNSHDQETQMRTLKNHTLASLCSPKVTDTLLGMGKKDSAFKMITSGFIGDAVVKVDSKLNEAEFYGDAALKGADQGNAIINDLMQSITDEVSLDMQDAPNGDKLKALTIIDKLKNLFMMPAALEGQSMDARKQISILDQAASSVFKDGEFFPPSSAIRQHTESARIVFDQLRGGYQSHIDAVNTAQPLASPATALPNSRFDPVKNSASIEKKTDENTSDKTESKSWLERLREKKPKDEQ